jgi:hypothetical protein
LSQAVATGVKADLKWLYDNGFVGIRFRKSLTSYYPTAKGLESGLDIESVEALQESMQIGAPSKFDAVLSSDELACRIRELRSECVGP